VVLSKFVISSIDMLHFIRIVPHVSGRDLLSRLEQCCSDYLHLKRQIRSIGI
jgi:hypothetical protein